MAGALRPLHSQSQAMRQCVSYRTEICDAKITWRLMAITDSYSDFDGRWLWGVLPGPRIESLSQICQSWDLSDGSSAGCQHAHPGGCLHFALALMLKGQKGKEDTRTVVDGFMRSGTRSPKQRRYQCGSRPSPLPV